MTDDFSSETMEVTQHFSNAEKKKNCQPRILYPVKISFMNEEEIKTFSDEEKLRVCSLLIHSKRMSRGRSLKRKEMIKEGILEHQDGRKNIASKNMDKYNIFSLP